MKNILIKPKPFHMDYRSDIDGIRAIAVILVLFFHAFPENLPGGFLGVDIFFVISGYLISSIILGGLKNKTYSLKNFYIKRINRIFPALLIVLLFSIVFGWFALVPEEYKELGRHSASAAFFVSNLTLWYQSGYFDRSSELKPLLHLWSLSVEEQFYIFWPLVMSYSWRRKMSLVKVSFFVILISFIINIYMSYNYHSGAFYSPISRFWEILIGAFLAFYKLENDEIKNESQKNSQGLLGVLLIVVGVVFVSKESFFPGFWALCPVIGTSLIISSGSSAWINRKILSNRFLTGIGLISYPLYLWHWPLISFANILSPEPVVTSIKLTLLAISFILAWMTYNFLELPLRGVKDIRKKSVTLLVLLIIVGLIGSFIKGAKGIQSRDVETINTYSHLSSGFSGVSCEQFGLKMKTANYCTNYEDTSILLVGDSHAAHLYYGLKKNKDPYFSKVSVMAGVKCNGLVNFYDDNNCSNYIHSLFAVLDKNPSIRYVVLAGAHQVIQTKSAKVMKKYFDGYSDMIGELLARKIKPIFFIDNLALKIDPLKCVESKLPLRSWLSEQPSFCEDAKEKDWVEYDRYDAFTKRLSVKFPSVTFFDSRPLICKDGKCPLMRGGRLLYSDKNHYSLYGSLLVGKGLIEVLNLVK